MISDFPCLSIVPFFSSPLFLPQFFSLHPISLSSFLLVMLRGEKSHVYPHREKAASPLNIKLRKLGAAMLEEIAVHHLGGTLTVVVLLLLLLLVLLLW